MKVSIEMLNVQGYTPDLVRDELKIFIIESMAMPNIINNDDLVEFENNLKITVEKE